MNYRLLFWGVFSQFIWVGCGGGLDCVSAKTALDQCVSQYTATFSDSQKKDSYNSEVSTFHNNCTQANKSSYTDSFRKEVECLVGLKNKVPDCTSVSKINKVLSYNPAGTTDENSCRVFIPKE